MACAEQNTRVEENRYTADMRAHEARAKVVQRSWRPRRRRQQTDSSDEPEPTCRSVDFINESHLISGDEADRVIDLFHPQAALLINRHKLSKALAFGFAGGDTVDVLTKALQTAPLAESEWVPDCFTEGLFIRDILEKCMRPKLGELEPRFDTVYLTRLLTHPPKDHEVVEFRRQIQRELADDSALRRHFRKTYIALHRLRDMFEPETHVFDPEGSHRRLETLAAIRDAFEIMADGFINCQSGLERIHRYATTVMNGDGYQRLTQLLDYDNNLAGVELKLRVGADGRIRRFEIVRVSENKENRFYQSPLGRFLTRLFLLFRGYFLGEGELINRWVDSVFDGIAAALPPLIQLLGQMELYLSSMAFKELAEAKGLAVCFPEMCDLTNEKSISPRSLEGLFNPLLFEQESPPVPCDIHLDRWETITVVTGPNSGGKTRLLQAVAIAQMFAQAGIYAPARAATLSWASGQFVSLIEEARFDQKEGRLGTELIRIRKLFEKAHPGYLIVLDELCSGTNPSEGEEIFRLVVSLLHELKPCVFITTHFLQFAARLEEEADDDSHLRFLQVELDQEDCPTYRFINGVAQTSLAHQTAARLGVTRDELLELLRRNL